MYILPASPSRTLTHASSKFKLYIQSTHTFKFESLQPNSNLCVKLESLNLIAPHCKQTYHSIQSPPPQDPPPKKKNGDISP